MKGDDDEALGTGAGDTGREATGHDASGKDGTGKAGQDSVSDEKQGKEVDIAPGKRLSVVVGCTAKYVAGSAVTILQLGPIWNIFWPEK